MAGLIMIVTSNDPRTENAIMSLVLTLREREEGREGERGRRGEGGREGERGRERERERD